MRRDRLTLGMIVGMPLMQLFLFGFAINFNPKALPTAISIDDPGVFARSIVAALAQYQLFQVRRARPTRPARPAACCRKARCCSWWRSRRTSRATSCAAQHPDLLIEADATDPAAGAFAIGAFTGSATTALRDDLIGPLAARAQGPPPFNTVTHLLYNPESNTQYNIVPGLLAVILTMTMVLMTCLALTRERERGTYENLLAMPATPLEIMIGKITPNIAGGRGAERASSCWWRKFVFARADDRLAAAAGAGRWPSTSSPIWPWATPSPPSPQNQLQAMQMTMFFLLPAILLSGFAFPFEGMPVWAQMIGEVLPATHFLRIVRGILLKDNGMPEIWPDLWPLFLFTLIAGSIALLRFRRTLD